MDLSVAKTVLNMLFQDVRGYDLSFNARKKLEYFDRGLTYGEIVPDAFYEMLSAVHPKKGEVFYDLGSGSGKAVFAAALFFPFSKTVGIEFLDDLYNASQDILDRFQRDIKPQYPDEIVSDIQFSHGDFLNVDFSDADIVFAHATCFHDGQIRELLPQLEALKKGAKLLVVSKIVPSESYQLISSNEYSFSWGKATLHSYEKTV